VPELPEVESARAVIERAGLRRRIVDVDDSDSFVCRPHRPGEIKQALLGGELVTAMRQGKSMWCQAGRVPNPVTLGIHLGMSGKIVIADPGGTEIDGGDYWEGRRRPGDYRWARFTLAFEDGGLLMLVDPRRLGRVRLNPPVEELGPDAQRITPAQFRAAVTTGTAPVKAHLLDQERIAGIGNLLADEILWRARIHPARAAGGLSPDEQSHLLRALRDTLRTALKDGGVHTLEIIPFRHAGAACPRDDAPMASGTVAGRTSWWCSAEQRRAGLPDRRFSGSADRRLAGPGQDGGADRPGQVAQLGGHDGRSPRIRRLAVQGRGQGAGEQVEVLGGRATQHHPVGPEQGQQRAEPGRHLLAVAFEGPRGAGIPGPGRGGRGGGVSPHQAFEGGTGRRLFPAPGQAAVAGHGRVADGEVAGLGMGAVPGPGQLAGGDDGDPDPGAEGDGDTAAAAAAGPVGVLPHGRGGRVAVDHAGPAGLLPDGPAQVHAGVGGQGGPVVDDAVGGDGPAGADPGRTDVVT
jgi:formamidopyrimidine-DNA glycosylase